jgi:hypothetical protein
MNKIIKICIGFAMLTYCIKSSAQVPVDTSTTQKLLQYIFQSIDKNQIPTGFLEEYGCPIVPMAVFNGTLTDSNRIDMNLWRTLYFQLQTGWAKSTSNPLPTISAVNTTIKQNVSNNLPIPIPLVIGQFNNVKSNAFTSNLLAYNSSTNRISDIAGRTQSPYDSKNLFAACPNKKQTLTGTDSFVIKTSMIWNNTSKTINQLQIDFANGQGFQTISIGTPIGITYADTGYKKWTIKVVLSDNSILQCYNDYYVLKTPNTASRFQSPQSTVPFWGIINGINNLRTGATVWVNYSRNNFTGTLRKPLIIVEGYDVNTVAPALQDNYRSRDFIDAITFEPGNTYDFNNQLDDIAGYDLVFVDFADGAADIVLNAGAVQEVINRINANKVNDNRSGNIRQQNVVMGLSMGGLCARFALANMTKNFTATLTETRLLITHDSPHQGANVPLGLQYLLRMVGGVQLFGNNILDIYPDYNDVIGLLNAPATQQLLTYRSLTANTFASNNFLATTYRNMITFTNGGPQPTYSFIATSLGNECARPVYNPYTQLLNVNLDGFILYFPIISYKIHTVAETFALPATGSTSKIARFKLSSKFKLFGFITISKDYYDNTAYAPGNQLAIDGVPGAVTEYASTTLPSTKLLFPIPGIFGFLGYISATISGTPGKFTFVSTASALDAGPYTTPVFSQKYVNGTNQDYPSTSQTFIAQQTAQNNPSVSNNVHIRFTARNSRWLFNEMENMINTENCSAECSNPYHLQGADFFCGSSGTYSIPGLQRGTIITWQVNKIGIVNLNCTSVCNTVTLTKITNGFVTLTATITNPCTSATVILSKTINIGLPVTAYKLFPIQTLTTLCGWDVTLWNLSNATGYVWQDLTPLPYTQELGQTQPYHHLVQENVDYGPITLNYTIAAVNQCGTGNFVTKSVNVSAPWRTGICNIPAIVSPPTNDSKIIIQISPNPTINSITATKNDNVGFNEIRIFDKLGTLRKQINYPKNTKSATINLNGLATDIYRLQAFDGVNWATISFSKL